MKVIWTELASFQLKEIYQYYTEVASREVAESIKNKIFIKALKLSQFPEIGQIESNSLIVSMNYRYLVIIKLFIAL